MSTPEEKESELKDLAASFASRSRRATLLSMVVSLSLSVLATGWLVYVSVQISVLERQRQNLISRIEALKSEATDLAAWKDRLSNATQSLTQSAIAASPSAKNSMEVQSAENALYAIGLYGFDVSKDKFATAFDALKAAGYVISSGQSRLLTTRPSWLAYKSTVLYYDDSSRDKARGLARELSQWTDSEFSAARGRGQGVVAGQEKWTFFVHYIGALR